VAPYKCLCQQGSTPTDEPKEKPMLGSIIRWFQKGIEIEMSFKLKIKIPD